MPRIAGTSVKLDHMVYKIDVTWDDHAFVAGDVAFVATALVTNEETGEREGEFKASVHLEPVAEGESPDLVVKVQDREIFRDNLSNLVGEDSVMDRIPRELLGMGNPIVGCLIRAGLSACISQILECKDQTAGREWLRPRLRAMGACLNQHGKQIAARMLLRAGSCVLFS